MSVITKKQGQLEYLAAEGISVPHCFTTRHGGVSEGYLSSLNIGLRAYGQHDPVIAYKAEGYEMFQAMITAIREETIRRMFLVRIQPRQEVKREKVARETGTAAASQATVKKVPVRNAAKKVGPNDPCPCGSGKKYKKCCMQKEKRAE